jgi:Protein kinase domain/AAA ATPase domain
MTLRPASESPRSAAKVPADSERYRFHDTLGRGGMAVVYEATDTAQQRRVAFKRLLPLSDPEKQRRSVERFEREFHVLSQLVHPRIVQVYDFGIDTAGAFYTMELLEGGDFQELAPLPWPRVCAVARDVCSALSVLHSRRFVHRDVSPRNVRCLPDGAAKLIDFGAMAPMGPTKLLVGTPPCCAPESLNMQGLDGRTDLFALGATLYYVLVGQHAFAARHFSDLADAWRASFPRPSEIVSGIPDALDALILDLLRLEPDARPASAAEVMARLAAIDGCDGGEQLLAAQSYLSTPTLVGRDAALARVQRKIERGKDGRGRSRSILIEGEPGVGRTRFLDACLLDATLRGHLVVRADADDAVAGDYSVARTVALQLLRLMPQAAREAAVPELDRLRHVIPELAQGLDVRTTDTATSPRAHLQLALHRWLSVLSRQSPFVLAIDDFHCIDEPSAALMALLEHDSFQHRVCLLITAESAATWTAESAHKALQAITRISLTTLTAEQSEALLRSLFGEAPHVNMLAHRFQTLCAGNPRDLLRLAQHVIDRGLVRYAAGAWTLPAQLDEKDLPISMAYALNAKLNRLTESARELACAFALCPDQSFSFSECAALGDVHEQAALIARVEELTTADIARRSGDNIKLSQRAWISLLRAGLARDRELLLEQRLMLRFEQRVDQEFRAAQHAFRAGAAERGLDLLVAHAQASKEKTDNGPEIFLAYLLTLPDDWFDTFEHGLRLCDALARPRIHKYILLSRAVGIMSMLNTHSAEHVVALFAELKRDSGLDDWSALDACMDPKTRLMTALARAQARYAATPERERVLDAGAAIPELARAVVSAIGGVMMALDVPYLRSLPQLAPLALLSPALDASNKLIEGVDARCTGRTLRARRIYGELLGLVQKPDRAGLDSSHAEYVKLGVMNGLGMVEAGLGLASCLAWADQLTLSLAYEVNAVLIRMLYCLFQGDVVGAEDHKQNADRLRVQNSGRQMYEGGHLIWEVQAHAMSADLTRMRYVVEEIAALAKRYPQWIPVLRYAAAESHRLVRDTEKARVEIEMVLELAPIGTHQVWSVAATSHVLSLTELGQHATATECADRYVAAATAELEYVPPPLQLARALARVRTGQRDGADLADSVIQSLVADGIGGLQLGCAYECRARIAMHLDDTSAFSRYAELCRVVFGKHKNSALTAKYHRLLQDGRRSFVGATTILKGTPDSKASYSSSRMELALASCRDLEQRTRFALTVLTRQSGATGGCIFWLTPAGPVCKGQVGDPFEWQELLPRVREYMTQQAERVDSASLTGTGDQEPAAIEWTDSVGRHFKPMLLSHSDAGSFVVTGIVLFLVPENGQVWMPAEAAAAVSRFYAGTGSTSFISSAK